MKKLIFVLVMVFSVPVLAIQLNGKVTFVEGHYNNNCAALGVKNEVGGTTKNFRILDNSYDAIAGVALTALTTGMDVELHYDEGVGSGCGTEPRVKRIRIKN